MDKRDKTIIIIALIAFAFISSVGIMAIENYKIKKLYITHGYEQVMVKGRASYLWQKKEIRRKTKWNKLLKILKNMYKK